jgi:L-fuconolactonase
MAWQLPDSIMAHAAAGAAANRFGCDRKSSPMQAGSPDPIRQRRRFLAQAGTLALAPAAATLALAGRARQTQAMTPPTPILDCHQHLWDLTRFHLPWIAAGSVLDRSYLPADYAQAIAGTGIVRAIYMEVDVDPAQRQAEAEWIEALCRQGQGPTVAAVVAGRPADPDFPRQVAPFRDSRYVKGIRQVLHVAGTPRGFCLQEAFVRGLRLLGTLGLSFDLCLRPQELDDAVTLARQCPDTQLILDHCGNADPKAFLRPGDVRLRSVRPEHEADVWRRQIDRLAACPNVLCKLSGIVARVPRPWGAEDLAPIVRHCLMAFGPERVVFGSDWPVCLLGASLAEWVGALMQILADQPAEVQRQVLHDNAVRHYRLGP